MDPEGHASCRQRDTAEAMKETSISMKELFEDALRQLHVDAEIGLVHELRNGDVGQQC